MTLLVHIELLTMANSTLNQPVHTELASALAMYARSCYSSHAGLTLLDADVHNILA